MAKVRIYDRRADGSAYRWMPWHDWLREVAANAKKHGDYDA